ncbi:MAG: CPBP family intramembrane metalloprotease, partial [Oligoflexia bacterium]|nr:CPBP family intramembrane metalloprotease [Oligoflexia bacterium]
LAPRSRASGWVEAWLSLPGHRSDLVWAWWLIGILVGTVGVALTLLGHWLGSLFSGLPAQPVPWVTVPVLVLLASALGLRSFLDVEDMRTAITRSMPVIFGIAVLTGIALAAEQRFPGLGGLVPVAGLGLAMAGRTTSTGIGLAIASSLLSTGALLASSIHTLQTLPGSMGAMSRSAARRAAGKYFPEVLLLALVALAGSSVWGPAALTGQDLAIATFVSMLAFIAAPALAISSPLDLDRAALLSWRRPPARAWLLLPLVVVGTLGLANLLWYAAVAVLPQNDLIEAYSQALTGFDSPLGLVAVSVVPGICEELLFRGAMLGLLRRGMATWAAVIVQALIFAALHGMAVRFPYTFGLGLVLGLLVVRTRSLWPAIVVHTLHNLLSTQLGDSIPGPESPWLWVAAVVGIGAVFFTGSGTGSGRQGSAPTA